MALDACPQALQVARLTGLRQSIGLVGVVAEARGRYKCMYSLRAHGLLQSTSTIKCISVSMRSACTCNLCTWASISAMLAPLPPAAASALWRPSAEALLLPAGGLWLLWLANRRAASASMPARQRPSCVCMAGEAAAIPSVHGWQVAPADAAASTPAREAARPIAARASRRAQAPRISVRGGGVAGCEVTRLAGQPYGRSSRSISGMQLAELWAPTIERMMAWGGGEGSQGQSPAGDLITVSVS